MIDEKKLIEAITNGEYTTGITLLDMELEQFIKDFPKIVTAEMRFPTVHEMAKDVVSRAMDEYLYNGKTISQWVNEIQKYQWIPCSERIPENEGMYLITSKVFYETEVQYVFYQPSLGMFICNGTPLAWMPLPDPYQKGE